MKPPDLSPDAPWKQRYRAPAPLYHVVARLAPERGLVAHNRTGKVQLYAWDIPSGQLRQLTDRPEGMTQCAFEPAGRYVYYLDDKLGNEIGHIARFPYEGQLEAGSSQDLTPELPAYALTGVSFSGANNLLGFIAATQAGFDLYVQPLAAEGTVGRPRAIFHSQPHTYGVLLSQAGDLAVVMSSEKTGSPESNLIAFDVATGERINELWDGPGSSVTAYRFSPAQGDRRLIATTTRNGLEQLLLWDPASNDRRDLQFPEISGAASPMDWSPDGQKILFSVIEQAVQQVYIYDLAADRLTRLAHPAGTISSAAFAPSGDILCILSDPVQPPSSVALHAGTGSLARVLLPAAQAPPGQRWRSVSFPSSDGQRVQAWLATPSGDGPFPTIIHMIGGPGGVRVESYMPGTQAWLDHGYAFCSVNYRGCSTFGQAFESKIFGNPGYWEVEDIVAARRYLIETSVARPDQVLLTGGSYGGYLTLQSLGRYPELWAGGMAGVAIADWAVQYEDTAPSLRGFQVALLGGTPQEKPEQYAASSPISYAERVQAPVLIIQGRNDTRTPARPIEMYEAKMKSLGKRIEVEWFETGHMGIMADVELAVQNQERMLRFAYSVLSKG